MAGICCGVVGEGDAPTPIEPSSRPSTCRSSDLLPLKYISDMAVTQPESCRKRQRQDLSTSPAQPRECDNSVENCDSCDYGGRHNKEEQNKKSKIHKISSLNSTATATATGLENKEVVQDCPKFGFTTVCGRRRDMEDAVSLRPSFCEDQEGQMNRKGFHFFGVYDGHGCSHVATMCKDRLHEIVEEEIGRAREDLEWKSTMERSFARIDEEVQHWNQSNQTSTCRCELQTPHCDTVGSTAVVAVVTPDKVIVSNCGDSRAVLCRNGVAIPLSSDHKPDRPDELFRIQAAGGRVIYWDGPRVLGVLAMSRAIGDNYLKPYVSSEPEVTVTERTDEDECLILASDGLWDVVSNDTACGVVRMCLNAQKPPSSAAAKCSEKACSDASILLTKLALARHSSDNVSVVVVDLRRDRHQKSCSNKK